jgi:hypothetical protein
MAEKDVGQRLAHRLAGQPGVEHRGHVARPRHQHRHPGVGSSGTAFRLMDVRWVFAGAYLSAIHQAERSP